MRWYVEPLAYDQRSFNAAALRLDRRSPGAGRPARGRARGVARREAASRDADRRVQASGAVRLRRRRDLHRHARRAAARARARGGDRLGPVQVVSGRAGADPGVPLAPARPDREPTGRPIDMVVATKFPSYVVRHPEKRVWLVHQFRQAYELDRTELGQFGESPEDRAVRRKVQELDRVALGEATPPLRHLAATSPAGCERSTGLVAEVLPHPAQELDYRNDGPRRLRPLGQPARPRQADRPADRGGRRSSRRSRSSSSATARTATGSSSSPRDRGVDGRVRFAGRVDADGARRSLRHLLRDVLRAGRRGLRARPVRVVPLRQAGDHGDRRRRAARGRPRRLDGPRRRARRRRRSAAAAVWLRDHPDEAAAFGRAGKAIAVGGHLGPRDRAGCSREGRDLQPDAARAVGDRRLLGAAPARAAARAARSSSSSAARRSRRAAPTSASTTSATTRTPTAGSSRRCGARPGVVVLHDFVLHHLVAGPHDRPPRRARLPRRDGARGRRRRAAARPRRPRQAHPAAVGEPAARTSISPARCSTSRPGSIVHSRYVHDRARAAGYDGPIWIVPHPAFPVPDVRRGRRSRASRSSAPSATSTRASACRSCSRRSRACGRRATSSAAAARRRHLARLRPRPAAAAARARRRRPRARGLRRRAPALGADDRRATCTSTSARRRWARPRARRSARSRSASRSSSATSAGSRSFPDDVALKVPVDDDEVDTLAAALELLALAPGRARGDGRGGARARPRASTTSTASPTSTSRRSSRRPAAAPSPMRCCAR